MEDWLELAKSLRVGQTVRQQHCGADKSMLVSHSTKGYSRYCFRCGDDGKDFVPHEDRSIADILRHKLESETLNLGRVELPRDFTQDLPTKAMTWMLKYGIDPDLYKQYGIGYTPRLDRVVLPVFENNELTAMQMRAVENIKPKYLNPEGPKTAAALFTAGNLNGVTVVVEDILSAIKIGRIAHATSTLGTSMTDQRAYKIAQNCHTAIIWYDNDAAGRKGYRRALRQLTLLGLDVFRVRSNADPKTYNVEQIKEHIRSMRIVS